MKDGAAMKYKRRGELKRDILTIVKKYMDEGRVNYSDVRRLHPTMTDIAFWLGRKPSNHLLSVLYEMEKEKLLLPFKFEHRPGRFAKYWRLGTRGFWALGQNQNEVLPL
jgi:hypothetical protein